MASNSHIEWTEKTWNPVTGCSKISPGCKHCYAERFAFRLQKMGNRRYQRGFEVTLHHDLIDLPFHWTKPSLIFVNSMSDLFHDKIPLSFIQQVFQTMNRCSHHQFQILTKRAKRLMEVTPYVSWTSNIWMGVSVESQDYIWRIKELQKAPVSIRFLSCEPLLGSLAGLPLEGIHWVIVGGESGFGARPMNPEWVDEILEQCEQNDVLFFFKQWGGVHKWKNGRILNNRTYDAVPTVAAFS